MTRRLSLVLALTASMALIAGPTAKKAQADDFFRNAAGAALIMGGVANMIQATQPQVNYIHGGYTYGGYPVHPGYYTPHTIHYPPANIHYPPANIHYPPANIHYPPAPAYVPPANIYPAHPGFAPGGAMPGVVPIVYPTNPQYVPTPF